MKNEALAAHLFAAFDANEDGLVDPTEFTAGLARLCGGSRSEQLVVAWRLFVVDGEPLTRDAFGKFVAAFSALGLAQVQQHVDLFHDMFGAAGGTHGTFGHAVWAATQRRADAHTDRCPGPLGAFKRP
jgi:hypothetical protein